MAPPHSDSFLFRLLKGNVVEALTLTYLLVLAYFTLLPFDFREAAIDHEAAVVQWGLTVAAPHWPDLICNVALYVPLGALFGATLVKRGLGRPVSIVVAVILAGALSYGTEYSQRFSPSRVCSLADFVGNVLGAIGGGLIAPAGLWFAGRVARTTQRDLRECPSAVLARAAAVALVVAAVIPFDIAVDAGRLRSAVQHPQLIPFLEHEQATGMIEAAAARGDAYEYHAAFRDWWMLRLDYAEQLCGYALLAFLVLYYLRRSCRMSVLEAAPSCIAACGLLALFAAVTQLFVLSRGFHATYIVVGLLGACTGVVLYWPIVRHWESPRRSDDPRHGRARKRLMLAIVTVAAALIVLQETAPFIPVATVDSIVQQLAAADRMPMVSYFHARLPTATYDLLHKTMRFVVLGIAISVLRAAPPGPRPARPWRAGFAVAAAVAALEFLQLLLPSRVPAVTDVVIGLLGTAAGVQTYRLAAAYYHDVVSVPHRKVTTIRYDIELGPTEEGPEERVPVPPARRPGRQFR